MTQSPEKVINNTHATTTTILWTKKYIFERSKSNMIKRIWGIYKESKFYQVATVWCMTLAL